MSTVWLFSFINENVQKDKLLIREDELFLRQLLSSLPKGSSQHSWIVLNFSALWLSTIAVWLLPKSYMLMGTVVVSFLTLVGILNAERTLSWWSLRCFRKNLTTFSVTLKVFKRISKNLFKILQEEEVLQLKYPGTNSPEFLSKLKLKFGQHLKDIFMATRKVCQDMKLIPDQVCKLEDDSSCISQLPLDTFDPLLTETTYTVSQLKGLMKLITLQASELFRKLLTFLAMSQNSRENCSSIMQMLRKLDSICQSCNLNLQGEYVYWEARLNYQKSQNESTLKSQWCDLECLINEAKTASFLGFSLLKKSSESVADEAMTIVIVESARKELLRAADLAQFIHDKYSKNTCFEEPIILPKKANSYASQNLEKFSETEENLDYEIFEADEISDEVPEITVGDQDFDFNGKIGISITMNEDLKLAILKKSEEHQERIAQALHLPVDEVSVNYFAGQDGVEKESKIIQKNEDSNQETINLFSSTLLSKLVVERGGKNLNLKEDTFGSSSSSCSEEVESNVEEKSS